MGDKHLRYFTFRSADDINVLHNTGMFEVKENFNNSYIWDLMNYYFKEDSVLWGFAYEENKSPVKYEYMGMKNLVEFIPDKVLVFTPNRHEMIRNSLDIVLNTEPFLDLYRQCKSKEEQLRLEEKLLRYDLGMTNEFLEFCNNEKSYNGRYIIMFPRLESKQVINISTPNRPFSLDESNTFNRANLTECSFCNGVGCAVCQLDKYLTR